MPPPEPANRAEADTRPRPIVPRWRRLLRLVWLVAVGVFLVVAVVSRRRELAEQLSTISWPPVVLSALLGLAGVGVSGLVWRRMLQGLGSRLPPVVAVRVFFVAQLGKYLPGSVWPVLAQAELGRDHGVPRRSAVAAQTLFMWVHLITGAVLGIPLAAILGAAPAWTATLAPVPLLLLVPQPLAAVFDRLLRRLRREPLPARPGAADMAVATGWAMLMWLLYGLHVHLLVAALEVPAPGLGEPVVAVVAFAASWTLGFLFLVAPAGAGAREVVLVAGLSAVAGPDTAFTVALLSRLLLTVADAAWGAVGLVLGRARGAQRA